MLTATRVLEAPRCLCMSEMALVLVRFRVQAAVAAAMAAAAGSGNTMEQSSCAPQRRCDTVTN